jgi:peptidoglycan/xylan/chitin deacetylase (PgdA/CDA1 family)
MLSLALATVMSGQGSGSTLPTPILLEAYDSTTGFTIGSAFINTAFQSSPKVQGAARFYGEGSGVSGTTPLLTKLNAVNIDPSTLSVIAYAIWFDERGQNLVPIQFGRNNAGFVGFNKAYNGFPPGLRWEAVHVSEIASLPTGTALTDIRLRLDTQLAPYNTHVGVDCLLGNAKGRPTVVIGFDDGERTTYDTAFPYMQSKNMVGTIYLPADSARIGDDSGSRHSGWLVVTECLAMKNAGWAIALDGTKDDTPMVTRADPAACVTEIQDMQAWLVSKGLDGDGSNHICYPNGWYQGDTSGVPPAAVQVAAATSDGAANSAITFGSAATVTVGMRMRGANVPANTRVTIVTDTTHVTVDKLVPVQTKAADFIDDSGAFYYPALPNALAAAGILTARTVLQENMYTRYGFGDQALVSRAHSTSAMTLADLQPFVDQALLRGETAEFYIHKVNSTGGSINMKDTDFYAFIDYIAAKRDAGLLDVLTKPQWWARDGNGLSTLTI